MNNKKLITVIGAAAMVLMLLVGSFMPSVQNVLGAPSGAVLTPVSNSNSNGGARFVTFMSGTPIAADTRACVDLGAYDVLDLQYKVTQTGVNTITVKHQYSNNNSDYVDANTFLSGTPVPASTPFTAMSQQALFGRYTCFLADVTNVTPVSVYVSGVAK